MQVLFFGKFGEMFGEGCQITPAPEDTPLGVIAKLFPEDPQAAQALSHSSTVFILDHERVRGDAPLQGGKELAFLPPVSGG